MRTQYGHILTISAICVIGIRASSIDDVFAGMPSSHLEDFLSDLSYMDYPENEKRMNDYEYGPDADFASNDYIHPVDQDIAQEPKPQQAPVPSSPVHPSTMLPAYCDPPNPCPIGYTSADGCIEDFENTSDFSRRYQATQKCICDTEHMFDCPEQNAHRGPEDIAAVNYLANIPGLVNTDSDNNPYMDGQKLPVAAKKGNF